MNWLTNFVRPTLQSLVRKRETPENLWEKCPGCEKMIFHRDLIANLHVCPHCEHHLRFAAKDRLRSMYDRGEFQLLAVPGVPTDPLKFRDTKRYSDRLKENRTKTGDDDSMLVAAGAMGGMNVVTAIQNFAFLGGSLGMAGGEGMITAAKAAIERKAPLLAISASGGARMQEGILSLMQMPRTTLALSLVREAGLPYFVLLTDPTTGGVAASFAMLGDVAIAEPGAMIAFTGQRVIENTIKEKLPAGFQTAEYLVEHGMIDLVVHRRDLRDTLVRLFDLLMNRARKAAADGESVAIPQIGYAGANDAEGVKRAAE